MKMLSLFLMTLALASAEVIRNGACPAVQPVQNFDLSAVSYSFTTLFAINVNDYLGCKRPRYLMTFDK